MCTMRLGPARPMPLRLAGVEQFFLNSNLSVSTALGCRVSLGA
jgi:hypothetical protein